MALTRLAERQLPGLKLQEPPRNTLKEEFPPSTQALPFIGAPLDLFKNEIIA
jgi:hypothetical protein